MFGVDFFLILGDVYKTSLPPRARAFSLIPHSPHFFTSSGSKLPTSGGSPPSSFVRHFFLRPRRREGEWSP